MSGSSVSANPAPAPAPVNGADTLTQIENIYNQVKSAEPTILAAVAKILSPELANDLTILFSIVDQVMSEIESGTVITSYGPIPEIVQILGDILIGIGVAVFPPLEIAGAAIEAGVAVYEKSLGAAANPFPNIATYGINLDFSRMSHIQKRNVVKAAARDRWFLHTGKTSAKTGLPADHLFNAVIELNHARRVS